MELHSTIHCNISNNHYIMLLNKYYKNLMRMINIGNNSSNFIKKTTILT